MADVRERHCSGGSDIVAEGGKGLPPHNTGDEELEKESRRVCNVRLFVILTGGRFARCCNTWIRTSSRSSLVLVFFMLLTWRRGRDQVVGVMRG